MYPPTASFPPRGRRLAGVALFFGLAGPFALLAVPPTQEAKPSTLSQAASIPGPKALELRDIGLAQLENEKPGDAAKAFRSLVEIEPADPLGWANRAVAALREQRYTAAVAMIDRALVLAPDRSDLLHIRGDVLQWSGRNDLALEAYRSAVRSDAGNVEALYSLYRLATQVETSEGTEIARSALDQLIELRPENLVLLLHRGRHALVEKDREAASVAFLRIAELAWQGPDIAVAASDKVLEALMEPETEAARIPAARLENVLKITAMYQQGLRELNTGVQGLPVWRFANEPPPAEFGPGVSLDWRSHRVNDLSVLGLAGADFDHDSVPDLALLEGHPIRLRILTGASSWREGPSYPAPASTDLYTADIDNDGHWDLVTSGNEVTIWRGDGTGGFAASGLLPKGILGTQVVAFDYDIEGDLDLVIAGAGPLQMWRNMLTEALEEVGERTFEGAPTESRAVAVGDFDRDGDLDLAVASGQRVQVLDNLRQGRLSPLATLTLDWDIQSLASGDLDNDGRPDLVVGGNGLQVFFSRASGWSPLGESVLAEDVVRRVTTLDADNDGRLDLATAGPTGVRLYLHRAAGFEAATIDSREAHDLLARDLDGDGDLDLLVARSDGLHRFENVGANTNGWLDVELTGLTKGNSKNNVFGLGSLLETRASGAYQFREAQEQITHFGLGKQPKVDLRVVWTNGVPQHRLAVSERQSVVEEQLLKGSCPFLYTWNGEEFVFVTDLLWGAPIGLPVAEGIYADADPGELVEIVGAVPRDGAYEIQITEELWEAAYFDQVRLWVVDAPEAVEVASNLRIVPGQSAPERILASRNVRPVAAAWDGRGREVTTRVQRRDEVYADGYSPGRYQGSAEVWNTTFDLGRAPEGPVRLHLDGWIFPADASLNLAMAQGDGPPPLSPRLEVETDAGWKTLLPSMGFPAGKTKTMVVDTPALPAGSRRLRIVTSLWLGWDRIAWTDRPDDAAATIRARLSANSADLHYRGFSKLTRRAPNAPHHYEYGTLQARSPWLPFPGRYTRYGDVTELLEASDDRSVILAAGDEMTVRFDASSLPPLEAGWRRTLFLESQGWDKDADRNTGDGDRMEPLPFRAMTRYPYAHDEEFPSTPQLESYRKDWLTRVVE